VADPPRKVLDGAEGVPELLVVVGAGTQGEEPRGVRKAAPARRVGIPEGPWPEAARAGAVGGRPPQARGGAEGGEGEGVKEKERGRGGGNPGEVAAKPDFSGQHLLKPLKNMRKFGGRMRRLGACWYNGAGMGQVYTSGG